MNLSRGDNLKPKKQAKEAKSIAKKVSKGSMPPEEFLKKSPEVKPTTAQIQRITRWATALKLNK